MEREHQCPKCGAKVNFGYRDCTECSHTFAYDEERNLENETPAFLVEFECGNCGREWSHKFKAKDEVHQLEETGTGRGVDVRVSQISKYEEDQAETMYRTRAILCPTCDTENQVMAVNREPITELD